MTSAPDMSVELNQYYDPSNTKFESEYILTKWQTKTKKTENEKAKILYGNEED